MRPLELKELRAKTKMSQARFGVLLLGVTGDTVGRWERGEHPILPLIEAGIRAKVRAHLNAERRK